MSQFIGLVHVNDLTWLLLIHDDRARCIFACYRLADDDGMPNLHITVVA